ncbi:hypothetical protein HG536_0C04140 [Torulaspora globosa]|uniref:RNA helicase n=1 Tax=Torulaspora globosa TaxID=48254 RepID=A0A7G3ZFF9_9SACH|nr:uncharacterized protein HG536_0C04140 [Torulaspora globosa]QLL32245.1 hypothetical protein HG536_0C04140 [Torulaspora globosa]
MSHELSEILGTEDAVVIDFVLSIKCQSKNARDFEQKIEALDVGLSRDAIHQVWKLLSRVGAASEPKLEVARILRDSIAVDDQVVVDFIINTAGHCKTLEEFQKRLRDMDCGISEAVASEIYRKVKPRSTLACDHGSMPTMKQEESRKPELADSKSKLDEFKGNLLTTSAIDLDVSPVLGKIYRGSVKNITAFGCFVQLMGVRGAKCDGLVHISEMGTARVRTPRDVVRVGQQVFVRVLKIQSNGKISLSMKNIDQFTGEEIFEEKFDQPPEARGRQSTRSVSHRSDIRGAERRPLTSPERWEIKQLIGSGAASIEDYPELNHDVGKQHTEVSGSLVHKSDGSAEAIEIEMNSDDEPAFLKAQLEKGVKKYEPPKTAKVPKGTLNRVAVNGSQLMKSHREEKARLKREIEQQIRKKRAEEDPTKNARDDRREVEGLRQQLIVTEWERSRMQEDIRYGKRETRPISAQRQSLPVYKMKSELLQAVQDNQFLVIVGETGSGKTTQITQYLNEAGYGSRGIIGCTQPRRVAAVSVSKRVAEEFGCKLGAEVGYTIRFEDNTSPQTRIKYMTDGMLQREALLDPVMSKYSVVMLDEAHERTVATDVLFGLLKKAAQDRPDLKIIVTSATLDAAKFSEYFCQCPVIKIPGKTFPVEVLYSQNPQMDYIESALDTVMEIHINEAPGDILVFLTGQDEIDSCCEILYQRVKTLGDSIGKLLILPVYSALPSEVQSKIFEPTPEGTRKVVFATNIAETSITIDGIYYVIDPGFAKMNTFNPRIGMEQLVVSPISQAQANQRKGRAGRTGPGKCYRLYTESAFYNEMLPNTIPEIQRQNLANTILMLKAMGISDILSFEFMDRPPKNLMLRALEELFNLQALDDDGVLTELGLRMSQFPMEPELSRALLSSITNNCSEDIITIISMLSVQSVFYRPKDKYQEADNKKARFHHPLGDHLTLLNVYNRWQQAHCTEQFCSLNYLHYRHLRRARDVRNQLVALFNRFHLPVKSGHGDPDSIRRALVAGFFMNAAKRDSQVGYKTICGGTAVGIHPSSSLFGKEYEYVIYHSLVLTSREYMAQVTAIDPSWLLESAPHFYKAADEDSQSRKKAKIAPLHNKFAKDQNSWKLSSIRQSRERALGTRR